ncbi:MAG: HEAT repeat domain-containing protein [Polyangiaceae bacterium]|nr:HEAT repeat domain-containing protein [Polyangiaceae bacterium]MCW5789583.1 HEAT repeat domain-containing protein [Polyangiaceae bacterium]
MLDSHLEPQAPVHAPPPPARDPAFAAKWPPDDDDAVIGGPPGGYGGGSDDGNFKKGRFKPLAIVVGLLVAGGLAAAVMFGMSQDAEKLTVDQAEEHKRAIFVLPESEQLPHWRNWATGDRSDYLRQEAIKQLAYLKDPEGIDLAIAALKDPAPPIQAQAAAAIAWYGSPAADKAKPALLEALKKAGLGSKPQIAWALVELGEATAFNDILSLYRGGHLSNVHRLDGAMAFNPEKLVKLVSLDDLAKLHKDESGSVRQLVATVLSRNADAKYTDVLLALLADPDKEISRQAAPGLGKIGDERARKPLVDAIRGADKDSRKEYLAALRDGIGTAGLVLALSTIEEGDTPESAWHQTKVIFDMIRKLADPRGGDALLGYIGTKPHFHWQTEAALAMAEVGDPRGVPTLASRLRMTPERLYSDKNDYEMMLKRDDKGRIAAARMIADLGVLHPDKHADLRTQAEDALVFWMHDLPSPHANALRALANMKSEKDLAQLRDWAFPKEALPLEGQQPPLPKAWEIAQSALRYIGVYKKEQDFTNLTKQLTRRERDLDVTMDGLMGGGVAMLGMSLRAIGYGASDGLSEWGDNRAFKPLLEYIEDPKNNEQSRTRACAALAWVAKDADMVEVAKKIGEYSKTDAADQYRRGCLLETLVQRPVQGTSAALVELVTPEASMKARTQAARAIGMAGFDQAVEDKLFKLMESEPLRVDAALALILGGSESTAKRAVAMFADKDKSEVESLSLLWYDTFGYWSHEDLSSGRIFRWVDNANAIAEVPIRQTPQEWAKVMLTRQLENLSIDNGPHSFTRVVMRSRLMQMAKGDDAAKREGAIRTLRFMGEQGVLLALRDEQGPTGELARAAYHELMHPKVVTGVAVPEDKPRTD